MALLRRLTDRARQLGLGLLPAHQRLRPIPVLEQIRWPVLAPFGELDPNIVPSINVPLLQAALVRGGNHRVTVEVFPKANHGLFECHSGGRNQLPLVRRLVPGYITTLVGWLAATA